MSSATHESLLQALRTVVKTALSLDDDQIIAADDKGPRPELPYLTINVSAYDVPASTDYEDWSASSGGQVDVGARGLREGTVSLQGYGRTSAQWLTDLPLLLHRDSNQAVMTAQGLDLLPPESGVRRVPQLVDTSIEDRFIRDLAFTYREIGATEEVPDVRNIVGEDSDDALLDFSIAL